MPYPKTITTVDLPKYREAFRASGIGVNHINTPRMCGDLLADLSHDFVAEGIIEVDHKRTIGQRVLCCIIANHGRARIGFPDILAGQKCQLRRKVHAENFFESQFMRHNQRTPLAASHVHKGIFPPADRNGTNGARDKFLRASSVANRPFYAEWDFKLPQPNLLPGFGSVPPIKFVPNRKRRSRITKTSLESVNNAEVPNVVNSSCRKSLSLHDKH